MMFNVGQEQGHRKQQCEQVSSITMPLPVDHVVTQAMQYIEQVQADVWRSLVLLV